jgi:hypothetical protein
MCAECHLQLVRGNGRFEQDQRGEIMLARDPVFRETATSLFQTDPLSRAQFFGTFKKISLEPERLLMLAVLEDAIKCVEKYARFKSGGNTKLFGETMEWIKTENDEWLFSFDNVSDAVGLNAALLRGALLDMVAGRSRILGHEQSRAHTVTRKSKSSLLVDRRTGSNVRSSFSRTFSRSRIKPAEIRHP